MAAPPLIEVLRTAVAGELANLARRDGLAGRSVETQGNGLLAGLLMAAYPEPASGAERLGSLLASLEGVPEIGVVGETVERVGPPGKDWATVLGVALNIDGRSGAGWRTLEERRQLINVPDSLRQRFRTDKIGSSTIRLKMWPEAYKVLSSYLIERLEVGTDSPVRVFSEREIARLSFEELSPSLQEYYYNAFLDQAPRVVVPSHRWACLLYTSDAADERSSVDLGGRRIIKKKNRQEHVGHRTSKNKP